MRAPHIGLLLLSVVLLPVLTLVFTGCNSDNENDVSVIPLKITGFSPLSGEPGTIVTITGTGFAASGNEVKFNGSVAAVTHVTATQLTVTVPANATTGKITVTTKGETTTSATNFTVLIPPVVPTITGIDPRSGIVADYVIISGTNFSHNFFDVDVLFNGVPADVRMLSATMIQVLVPAEATTGKITVITNGLTATSIDDFTITPPAITSFTPAIGAQNVSVVITGKNFCDIPSLNIVKFNGVTGTVTAAITTELRVKVPAGVSTGKISVKVGPNTVTSTQDLTICGSPELIITRLAITSVSADKKECHYRVTLLNVGGQPLDFTQWGLQTFISTSATGTDVDIPSGGTQLNVLGTLQSGESTEYEGVAGTVDDSFNTYPYLILNFHLKVDGSVPECNTLDNKVIKRIPL